MRSRWKQYLLYASLIIVGGSLLFILVQTVRAKNTGFETKTLWDWMQLLIIPLFLAGGAIILNRSEKNIERQREVERAKLEREIATDRQQEAALQAYIDRMSELLINENLLTTEEKKVSDLARTRTLSMLRGLDAKRKGLVVLFLNEAGLINCHEKTVVSVRGADLTGVDLSGELLFWANLSSANLSGANLQFTLFDGCDLNGSSLVNAQM